MRTLIAYALTIFGVPIALASWAWFLPGLALGLAARESYPTVKAVNALLEGAISSVMALFLFRLLSVPPTWAVPFILAFVGAVWLSARNERHLIVPTAAGVLISYAVFAPA